MLYHIIVSRSDGNAFARRVRSAVPDVFPRFSLFEGQPALRVTYEDGSVWFEHPYEIVQDPVIIGGSPAFPRVQLSPEALAALPHTVPLRPSDRT